MFKAVIGGKMYNTETAEHIGNNGNVHVVGKSNFRYFTEDLYRKKTGEFFLHGEGGPLSKYAEHEGNQHWGGKKIIPLSIEEAKEWVENNLSVEAYINLFGEPEE